MSVFGDYAAAMREQEKSAQPQEYVFSVQLVRRIRLVLVNDTNDNEESDFLLDNLKIDKNQPTVSVHTFIAHHLYEFLQGAAR